MTIGERTGTITVSSSVASGVSFGGTASLPTGTANGDYTIAQFCMQGSSIATPSGWTLLFTEQSIATSTETIAVFGRQWTGTPAVPTTTSNGTGRATLILHTITGQDTTTQPDVSAHISNYAGSGLTTYTDSGVTTVTQGCLAVSVLMFDSSTRTITDPSGWTTVAKTTGSDGGRGAGMASKPVGAAGSSTSVSWTISGTGIDGVVAVLAFRPASVSFTGSNASTTTGTGSVDKGKGFDGSNASTTTGTGTLNLGAGLTGSGSSTTTGTGALLLGNRLAGSNASTTTAFGDLTVQSNVFSGVLEIELTPGSGVWTDFTSRIDMKSQALTIRYGRPTVYDDVGAGQLSCSLFDDDGQIMPDNPGAAFALEEGLRLRWRVSKAANTWTRFYGWISNLVPEFPGASTIGTRVQVTAVDALGLLGQRKLRSNWTELALAAARSAGTTCDAYEAAGTAIGYSAIMTNYSTDASKGVGSYAYGSSPNLSFTSDRDTSVGPVVSSSPDSNGNSNTSIAGFQSSRKCVQWLVKTPSSLPASGAPWTLTSLAVSVGTNGINITCEDNGSGDMRMIVTSSGGVTSLGTLINPAPHGQWVLITVKENGTTSTKCDVTATPLGTGTAGTVSSISFDLKTITYLEFPQKVGKSSAGALGGVVGFGSRSVSLGYTEATVLGSQGTVSSRLADLQSALSQLPISWASSGTFDRQCVTGDWSDRTALEVLQELMRTNLLSQAFARPRDSTIYTMGYDVVRPTADSGLLATIDTDGDCAGAPRLNRSMSTRPTRVQVDAPGMSSVQVDAAAEAGPGTPQRLKTVTTVCATASDLDTIGQTVLLQRTKLRIEQMTADLTTGITDHSAELFSESGALTGLAPGSRVRAVVPVSHFGARTRDYYVQGWTETYSPKAVTITLDTDPCPTTTLLTETWTGSNGSAWNGTTWPATFGDALTGATFDVQSNAGRVVAGASGSRAGKRSASTYRDVEITGTVKVTGSAEAQVYWRSDSTFANGYALVFSVSGGIRVQQVVAGTLSTRYTSTDIGGPAVVAGTNYSLRIRHQGKYLEVKVWASSGSEPLTWNLDVEDTLYSAAGYLGLATWGASTTSTFDSFTMTDGA